MPLKKKSAAKKAVSIQKSTRNKPAKDKTPAFERIGKLIENGGVTRFEDFYLNSVSKTALGKAMGIQNVSFNKKLKNPLKFTFKDSKKLSEKLGLSHERTSRFICDIIRNSAQK